jgi:hypothetical protein
VGKRIRVLFLAADPSDLTRTRLAAEFQVIRDALKRGRLSRRFLLEPVFSTQIRDMNQAVLNFRPHVIQFSGHGSMEGDLVFENPNEEGRRVGPEDLEAFFAQLAGQVDCVLLNSCFSERQAIMISKYVPYAIGFRKLVSDPAAICFARGFYQFLSAKGTLEGAFESACALLRTEKFSNSVEPILKVHPGSEKPLAGPWGKLTGTKSKATVKVYDVKAGGSIWMIVDGALKAGKLKAGENVVVKTTAVETP